MQIDLSKKEFRRLLSEHLRASDRVGPYDDCGSCERS